MNIEEYRDYCLSLPGAEEGFPFNESTLVFKVKGKMFSATDVDTFELVNLKCDPVKAIELRERYEFVVPGYHMNKAVRIFIWHLFTNPPGLHGGSRRER